MANSITIQIRGDTAANWTSKNPVPKDRELCYDKTNNQLKTGDGTTAWNSLKYTPEIVNGLTSTSANAALSAAQGKALADRITTLENKPSGSSVNVINNLTSTSTTDALSAAQGKALNDKIPTVSTSTSSTSTTTAASSSAVKAAYDLANTANNKIPSGTILTSSNYSSYISTSNVTLSDSTSSTSSTTAGSSYAVKKAYDHAQDAYNLAYTAKGQADAAQTNAMTAYNLANGKISQGISSISNNINSGTSGSTTKTVPSGGTWAVIICNPVLSAVTSGGSYYVGFSGSLMSGGSSYTLYARQTSILLRVK